MTLYYHLPEEEAVLESTSVESPHVSEPTDIPAVYNHSKMC